MKCPVCNKKTAGTWSFCAYCGVKLPEQPRTKRKTRVRGNGEGSVYQQKNGKWTAQKVCGRKTLSGGKSVLIYARKYGFATKKEALAALPLLTRKGTKRKSVVTLREVFEQWQVEYERRERSKKTANGYASAFKYYEDLYNIDFPAIGIDDLQECVDNCPHGKRTRQMMKNAMSLIYKYAIPRHISYDDTNLATFLFCTGDPSAPKVRFNDAELLKLKGAIGIVPFAEYVYADCYLGYRPSEFVALDCENYDYDAEYFKAGAKTAAGKNRAVTISPKIKAIVDKQLAGRKSGPVFCDANGERLDYDRWRDTFMTVLEALDIPTSRLPAPDGRKLTPHCCRHTARSLMDHANGTENAKMEIIGHSSEEMSKRYTHQELQHLKEVTDTM